MSYPRSTVSELLPGLRIKLLQIGSRVRWPFLLCGAVRAEYFDDSQPRWETHPRRSARF